LRRVFCYCIYFDKNIYSYGGGELIKGLDLSRRYWEEIIRPALQAEFPDKLSLIAAGLVGDGSECYGFDDEISQDHDFGPRIFIWLTETDYISFGKELGNFLNSLPKSFLGYNGVNTSQYGDYRGGVYEISRFYKRFTGLNKAPSTLSEWRFLPEVNLSLATNGEVFYDGNGAFSDYRKTLSAGYPQDIKLKKLAARCMKAAQSGQYNYPRCKKRGEEVAALLALSEFIDTAASLIYLLNNRYKPFYKWLHRGLTALPVLGGKCYPLFKRLTINDGFFDCQDTIEEISQLIINELQQQNYTDSRSDFLLDHGPEIQRRINDEQLRFAPLWSD
jgi:hypothetical protein